MLITKNSFGFGPVPSEKTPATQQNFRTYEYSRWEHDYHVINVIIFLIYQ